MSLTTTCSVVIQKSLPLKMQDPDSFTIPCTIGNQVEEKEGEIKMGSSEKTEESIKKKV